MNKLKKYLFNHIYLVFSLVFVLVSITFIVMMYFYSNKVTIVAQQIESDMKIILLLFGGFIAITLILIIVFIYFMRKQVVDFTQGINDTIDKIILKEEVDFDTDKETLLSKLENKLKQLLEMMDGQNREYLNEKDAIKSLIADISHQIKTPIANISMYNDTLIDRELTQEQQKLFLNNMKFQVGKLEWLVESLIKMSRLESNIISLNKFEGYLNETIANALSGVYLKSEQKKIEIEVNCPEKIKINHDRKWTSEALFNILDNAIKYTNSGGKVSVHVEQWELFVKIDIRDTGIGIAEEDYHKVFRRFYRCADVSDLEGVGIGLYLANEIIIKQGGYIKVKSEKNRGTTFSIFLQNSVKHIV